jgi:hypothetical protein
MGSSQPLPRTVRSAQRAARALGFASPPRALDIAWQLLQRVAGAGTA